MRDKGNLVLLGIAFVAALCIGLLYGFNKINTLGALEIAVLTTLVIVTMWYAKSTRKMAEEMREQRLSEARPYLLIRLQDELVRLGGAEQNKLPNQLKIAIRNVGKGPAINIIAAFWRTDGIFAFQPKGYLTPQEEWPTTINTLSVDLVEEMWLPELSKVIKYDGLGTIAVEYHDIHGLSWVTYLRLMKYISEEEYVGEGEQSILKR